MESETGRKKKKSQSLYVKGQNHAGHEFVVRPAIQRTHQAGLQL